MKIFEVAGVGKLHGLTVMSLDAFVKDDEKEVEEAVEGRQKHKVAVTVSDPNHSAVSQRGETRQRMCSVTADGREQACDTAVNWYKKQGYRVHDHNYVGTVEDTVKEGVMSDLHLQFADVYDELAPGIEKHKDSAKAGQLYDALKLVAEKNGAVSEFKRMMMSARNSAHQDYDTNPGGFENWFWYLPFGDLNESQIDEIDRRGFLRGLGAAGAAAMVPGLAKASGQVDFESISIAIKDIFAKHLKLSGNAHPTTAGRFNFIFDKQGKLVGKKQLESCGDQTLDAAVLQSATDIPSALVDKWQSDSPRVSIAFGVGDGWWKAGIQKTQQAPAQQNTLYGNIKIGMSVEQIIKNNPGITADAQWSSMGVAGTMSDYLGIDSPKTRIKAAGTVKGPYGTDAKIFILTNKNLQCNGVIIANDTNSLPENWVEDHGALFGFNKGEFLTFLKKVVSNIPRSMGTRSGKLKTREDGGLGLSGGFGAAVPVGKNATFGIGVGMAKQGIVAITQKLDNGNIDSNMTIVAQTLSHQLSGINAIRPSIIFALQDKTAVVPDLEIESVNQGVAEGGEKYKVKSIGHDAKGDYYISPSTGEKVYKSGVERGDHENPNTGEIKKNIAEAPGDFGLGANYRAVPDAEMQDLMGRSKNKTKTKRDKFDYPYIHGSNIQVKDEGGKTFDAEALKKSIMVRPGRILGQNAKMQHSETGTEAIFDIGLPALKGLAVNEKTGEFVVVDTCPGAGACKTFCYAMKGSYVMFKAVSMGLARMLNFLLNDPEGFASQLNAEIAAAKSKMAKKNAKVVVRWHDAGDFFSAEYLDMAYGVANANPDVGFYAYTKMADVATGQRPKNFNMNFSGGALSSQEKKIDFQRVKHSKVVPKDMFFDLIARDGTSLKKDAKGRMQFASPENLDQFKSIMAQKYAIDKNSILTYDEMMKTPVGDKPKWNTIVMPGDGDNSANRNDVVGSYLLFH